MRYCKKCDLYTKDMSCEKCYGETTDLVPKEELLEEGIETKKNVLKGKKNIQILIIIIIVVGLFSICSMAFIFLQKCSL
ncbi:hypothetical protein NNC19_18815 [Clostridium sp. SHJSY1]|uniref:hypothetical protein n=1 Tax=Clostridium sp. SHJSY1 TaxID=2942483 RepID=UPI002874A6CA|nr:hypothetical protein [Clostridium sp. SHJSY1]MDS0527746.1 hypothetical protein [Clostridium sp. SHJSY1]